MNKKKYVLIVLLSTIFAFYLFEGYLILDEKKYIKYTNYKTKSELYEDFLKQKKKSVFTIYPKYIEKKDIYTLSGISNSLTIFCNELGFYATYESDRYGFNNINDIWDKKIEYLLIGDSFVQGACVHQKYIISSNLNTISGKSALNLGGAGNGPLTEYASLREYFLPNTKNVLWFFYENDFEDLESELKNKILKKYLNNLDFSQNLKLRQKEIDSLLINFFYTELNKILIINEKRKRERSQEILKIRKQQTFFYKFLNFIKLSKTRYILIKKNKINKNQKNFIVNPELQEIFKKIITEANNFTINNGSNFYFIYLPSYQTVINKNNTNQTYLIVKKIINNQNIKFIDIYQEVFQKNKNSLNLFALGLPNHYNEEGYKQIAEKIFQIIQKY
jgi:hypothetical protein